MRFYTMLTVLVVAFLFLQLRLWFQQDGVRDLLHLKQALALQMNDNEKLRKDNDELIMEVKRMQNSAEATESRARNELGMIKKNETFYQIIKKEPK